ncbi:MAG: tetratricopeptide repeat protein, partial [Cyanobacteriota bacterium]
QPIPIDLNIENQNGSKVIDVYKAFGINTDDNLSKNNNENNINNIEPREIDSFPLGLSENFEEYNEDSNMLVIPAPKPAYASDRSLAVTVISSKGVEKKQAEVRNLNINGNEVINNSGRPSLRILNRTEVKTAFKKYVSEAKDAYAKGKTTEAESLYKMAISVDQNAPWGYIAIASFYEGQERYNEAINAYKKAVKFLPNRVELLYNLALNEYKIGDYQDSIDHLHKVIEIAPGFTLAYYNLGTLYYNLKEYDESIKYLTRAVKLNPVLIDAHFNLGLAYMSDEKINEAAKHFESCLNIDPDDKTCKVIFANLK